MYRQILIDPSQTSYQRILFRKTPNDPIEDYESHTATFEVNSIPFSAIRTLLQLADKVKSTHHSASKIPQHNMYVNDLFASGHTTEDTIKSRTKLFTVLKAANNLTTQAFLAAFSRFIGRRRYLSCIHLDNGTNFVRAAELIKNDRLEFLKTLQQHIFQQQNHINIEWKFMPPDTQHITGFRQTGLKSFKTHLQKILHKMKFTFKARCTILTCIEICFNSRPLSPASDDPINLTPLTPRHFLITNFITFSTERDIKEENFTLANRWKCIIIIYQLLYQRSQNKYLAELRSRYKWKFRRRNTEINDLHYIIKFVVLLIKTSSLIHSQNLFTVMLSNLHISSLHRQWSCSPCKQGHIPNSLNSRADKRYKVIVMQKYCINGLTRFHSVQIGKNEFGCHVMSKPHNTVLHDTTQLKKHAKDRRPADEKTPQIETQITQIDASDPFSWSSVFVPTASVQVYQINPANPITRIASNTIKWLWLHLW